MSALKIAVSHLYDGESIQTDKVVAVDNGIIQSIKDAGSDEKIKPGLLIPGFIDTQVNGGGGYLFNQQPSVDTISKIGAAHQKFGTTGWLPTLVTDSFLRMEAAAEAVAESIVTNCDVLGIHFEGPFLSTNKKGVHSQSLIRKITDKDMALLARKDLGKVLLTVAPENVSPSQITELVESGVIVSVGHSAATFEQVIAAINAGATGFTHLYNAMSPLTSREPGVVGAALASRGTYSGIILDGVHVHPAAAKIAFEAKTKLMIVTDAMPPVGTNDTEFEFFGQFITRKDKQLRDLDGRLAGSTLDMLSAVKNACYMLDIDILNAINLATSNPAKFLGLDSQIGKIETGYQASMLLFDSENNIQSSWICGRKLF